MSPRLDNNGLPFGRHIRWTPALKAVVVKAVRAQVVTLDAVLSRYSMSQEEFDAWCSYYDAHGQKALRATTMQLYGGRNLRLNPHRWDR